MLRSGKNCLAYREKLKINLNGYIAGWLDGYCRFL